MEHLTHAQKQIYRSVIPVGEELIAIHQSPGRILAGTCPEESWIKPQMVTAEILAEKILAGEKEILVKKKPLIGILSFGDKSGGLSLSLSLLIEANGAAVKNIVHKTATKAAIEELEQLNGLIIISNQHEAIVEAIEEKDGKVFFQGLNIQPGGKLLGAVSVKRPILVVPEDPYEAIVCCQAFFLQSIKNMIVGVKRAPASVSGEFKGELENLEKKNLILPVNLSIYNGVVQAWPLQPTLADLANAKGLVFLSEDEKKLDNYSIVQIFPLAGFESLFI